MEADVRTRALARIDALAEAERAATPGPWQGYTTTDAFGYESATLRRDQAASRVRELPDELSEDDHAFAAALRNAAPALLVVARAAVRFMEANDRACWHDSSVERMDARGEAQRHRAAFNAALAALAPEG